MSLHPPPPEVVQLRQTLLRDLATSQFQAWRHHPVSRAVLQFLEDYRDSLRLAALDAFEGGELTAMQEHEARGRMLMCAEIVGLHWENVLLFYGIVPEPDEVEA